jgi:hypothetical protein
MVRPAPLRGTFDTADQLLGYRLSSRTTDQGEQAATWPGREGDEACARFASFNTPRQIRTIATEADHRGVATSWTSSCTREWPRCLAQRSHHRRDIAEEWLRRMSSILPT